MILCPRLCGLFAMKTEILKLQNIIDESRKIVFFGGAGVSTESGIPDFRSKDGLYNLKYSYPPETIISRSFFERYPEEFYRFYRDKMLCLNAKPNACHYALKKLEEKNKLDCIITQNIDGLHYAAGSKKVYELHGSVMRNYCVKCRKFYTAEFIKHFDGIPRCSCGGIIKPDVVLYEENLDERTLNGAINAISRADTMIIGGTSLVVYPAAALIDYFNGKNLVVINLSPTPRDEQATLLVQGKIGEIFSEIEI